MWLFYALIALMTAGVAIRVLHPLLGRQGVAPPTLTDRRLALAVVSCIAILPLVIYLPLGRPDLPGQQKNNAPTAASRGR